MPDKPGAKPKNTKNERVTPAPAPKPAPPEAHESGIPKQAWGEPLVRFDKAWTRFESRLCAWVLMAEIAALCLWISLKGLSAEYQPGATSNISGIVFRSLLSSVALGILAHRITRPKTGASATDKQREAAEQKHRVAVTASVVVGLALGRLWPNGGVSYFSNLLNWMQGASLLSLIGGLRGVATRLTLWLALLGGSIATQIGTALPVSLHDSTSLCP